MAHDSARSQPPASPGLPPALLKMYGAVAVFFVLLGVWLVADLRRAHNKVVAETTQRAVQRSQIVSQSLRTQVLATDYVLRDVLGRINETDLVFPDPDPAHAQRMTSLLKEKADTVPDFFSMVVFNQNCVFTATPTGENTGVRSRPALCEARRQHQGDGPLATYVPGMQSASGRSVIVLSRHLRSHTGDFLGGVLGVIELERAQQRFDALVLGDGDSVALLDDQRVLLARHPLVVADIEKPVTAYALPAQGVEGSALPVASAAAMVDLDGIERWLGFSRIDGFPFTVVYGLDRAKALEDWRRRTMELTAGYAALLLLALLVARSQWGTLRQREALRASEAHFRMLAENMADIVWRTDAQMRFTYINAADERVRGFAREEVIGTRLRDNIPPHAHELLDAHLKQRRETERSAHQGIALKYELPMRHKQGDEVWVEMSSVPIYGNDGSITAYQGVGRDISGRRLRETSLLQTNRQLETQLHQVADEKSALQELAMRDPLTGLYNRGFLDAALPRELARALRERQQLALVMLDLDHFKKVNDQHGHAAGDEVLKALAALLKQGARESDLICRYGGEEFVAILSNLSVEQALQRVEAWRLRLADTVVVCGDVPISVTLSAGISMFPDHGNSPEQLLASADAMLYQSKREGRNRTSVGALSAVGTAS